MRIIALLVALAALAGSVPASADCTTTCSDHNAAGQRVCNTHCW